MHRRARIVDRKDVVDPMAVGAHGNPLVALIPLLAMHAGVVESQLIGAERRIESLHALPVRMAGAAQLGDLRARNVAAESAAVGFRPSLRPLRSRRGRSCSSYPYGHARSRRTGPQQPADCLRAWNGSQRRRSSPAPPGARHQHHKASQPPTEILENPHLPILVTSTRIRPRSWKRGRSSRK